MTSLNDDIDNNYEIFLAQAVDTGLVWALKTTSDDFALCESTEDLEQSVMPFWSSETMAKVHSVNEWAGYQAVPVELDDFIDHWLPGMQKDHLLVGTNWNDEMEGLELDPLDLSQDLLETD